MFCFICFLQKVSQVKAVIFCETHILHVQVANRQVWALMGISPIRKTLLAFLNFLVSKESMCEKGQ